MQLNNCQFVCVQHVLSSAGTCAIWVPCGHEIRLEARKQFVELLFAVSNPTAALIRLGLLPPLPPPIKEKPVKKTTGFAVPPPMMPPSIRGKSLAAPAAQEVQPAPKVVEDVGSLDSLLKKQASTEAAFKTVLDEQRAKQIEFERTRAEKLQEEQIARRRQWQQEDEARLEQIKRTLSSQQEQRLDEVRGCELSIVIACIGFKCASIVYICRPIICYHSCKALVLVHLCMYRTRLHGAILLMSHRQRPARQSPARLH